MIAGIRGAPVLKHPLHTSLCDMGCAILSGTYANPRPATNGPGFGSCPVESHLAFGAHPQVAVPLLEAPGIQPAVRAKGAERLVRRGAVE
jgi:hypothetical protein